MLKHEIENRLMARYAAVAHGARLGALPASGWEEQLAQWQRKLQRGERLMFDAHSSDHIAAYAHARDAKHARGLAIGSEELIAAFDRLGLSIVAVVPFGGVSSEIGPTLWLTASLASGRAWERILSWVTHDPLLLEFMLYVEEAVIGALTSETTARFLAVADNTPDPQRNAAWIARDRAFKRALRGGFRRENVEPFIGAERWEDWCTTFRRLLDHEPNIVAAFCLCDIPNAFGYPVDLEALAGAPAAAELRALLRQRNIEKGVWNFVTDLQNDAEIGPLLASRAGYAPAFEADLIPRLNSYALGVAGDD